MQDILENMIKTLLILKMNLNYLEVTVDGQPVPNRALTPNFEKGDFILAYLSSLDNNYDKKSGNYYKIIGI